MMNRLQQASSPYLLQHQHNPVHWWEWGPAALAEAQRLNRPVLLSIGYAACHWCHVMAHESFEDARVAQVMNELFVNIKVDREERPDVDQVYMSALHALGEQGGWPLTMFLTAQGEPFWGGTYFPKEPRFGRPGFVSVLREIARIHQAEPERVVQNAQALKAHLTQATPAEGSALTASELNDLGRRLSSALDPVHGGLPGAPKFPNPPILECVYRHARRSGDVTARERFLLSMERMALGGIHDHLGGGFARYAVDERWLVPHFEKMLYDNAQLLELYALAFAESGRALFRHAAEGIVAWLRREMVTAEGAFAASLDADSEGVEGKFYVWNLDEIRAVLGADATVFAAAYDISSHGNWEETNIPNLLITGELPADLDQRLAPMREKLLARRASRIRPGLDDKVLADWNGLMIASLVRASSLLDRPDWIDLAATAYRFIAESMNRDGRLGHSWRGGSLIFPGFALDHAAMMRAALALFETTGEPPYLDDAQSWSETLRRDFTVAETGTLAMTSRDGDALVVRPQPVHDDAVPNANGVFAEALVRLAQITGRDEDHRRAEDALATLTAMARASPFGHTSILNALDLHLRGLTIVITGTSSDALREAALRVPYTDRSVQVMREGEVLDAHHPAHAAVAGHEPQALICAGMHCSLPVRDREAFARQVREMLSPA
ncbi:thioredoxin domain-containing protein [Microvirga brassicacearum]|uniref:Thioredoxin domain-containing protein n=2 Tax=Microvirga brassicacearum TaxID=2580413 RepID=A0A5N3PE70_9HYPH|nr:thioredoxin domain-containing protein [Microvirga brassicacearum]